MTKNSNKTTIYVPRKDILEFADVVAFEVDACDFPSHTLRYSNQEWLDRIGLGELTADERIAHFGKFTPLKDNLKSPQALAYHGHQFGAYNPQIGDGRGFLFAQLEDDRGRLLDLGTKGSGRTPFSRDGDGRLTLKGGVREVLATQYLEAQGVYTSKSLNLIETGEQLYRGDEPSPTRSSVLVRLSHSHIRFGTFQRLRVMENYDGIEKLIRYCAQRYYPDINLDEPIADVTIAFFDQVSAVTANMVASWMAAGFVHGVMNTDNMVITGESFDYGPYRFLPYSDPDFVAAYFDQGGRYRFANQPSVGLWNLQQLAGCLLKFASEDKLVEVLNQYADYYKKSLHFHFHRRLGLKETNFDDDGVFVSDLLAWMTQSRVGWEQFFFDWFCADTGRIEQSPLGVHYKDSSFLNLRERILSRTPHNQNRLEREYFQKNSPTTLLVEDVETIWEDIAEKDNWRLFDDFINNTQEMKQAYNDAPINIEI